jgi:hypothetical protein
MYGIDFSQTELTFTVFALWSHCFFGLSFLSKNKPGATQWTPGFEIEFNFMP